MRIRPQIHDLSLIGGGYVDLFYIEGYDILCKPS
jgi:hypothetical protein